MVGISFEVILLRWLATASDFNIIYNYKQGSGSGSASESAFLLVSCYFASYEVSFVGLIVISDLSFLLIHSTFPSTIHVLLLINRIHGFHFDSKFLIFTVSYQTLGSIFPAVNNENLVMNNDFNTTQ